MTIRAAQPDKAPEPTLLKLATHRDVGDGAELEQEGFNVAGGVWGDLNALRLHLRAVAEGTASADAERRIRLQRRIAELDGEIEDLANRLNVARNSASALLAQYDDRIAALQKEVARIQAEIAHLKANPDHASSDYHPIKYWLLAFILAALTAYLCAFYPSVLFTAVFSNLGAELDAAVRAGNGVKDLFNPILDPRALAEAAKTPVALVWVCLFTALPLAIGAVTHATLDCKWRWGVKAGVLAALLALALVIDGVIAYRIAQRLHEARFLTGATDTAWTPLAFVEDINFWFVILVGFGAYVVWGLVLFFYLEEDRARHPEREAVRARSGEASRLGAELARVQEERRAAGSGAQRAQAELAKAAEDRRAALDRAHKDLSTRIVNWSELEARLDRFTEGWIRYLKQSREATATAAAASEVLEATKQELKAGYTPVRAQEVQP